MSLFKILLKVVLISCMLLAALLTFTDMTNYSKISRLTDICIEDSLMFQVNYFYLIPKDLESRYFFGECTKGRYFEKYQPSKLNICFKNISPRNLTLTGVLKNSTKVYFEFDYNKSTSSYQLKPVTIPFVSKSKYIRTQILISLIVIVVSIVLALIYDKYVWPSIHANRLNLIINIIFCLTIFFLLNPFILKLNL